MPDRPQPVTETELAILRVLWDQGEATIRQLTEELYPSSTAPQYATVQKLLERLEAKQCVRRDRTQRAHRFRATLTRDDFIGSRLQGLADKLCDGSLTPLLTHLVRSRSVSAHDRQALRQLIDQLAEGKSAGRQKK